MATKQKQNRSGTLVENRKARHDYTILEKFEAGIELVGTEVKVLRNGEGGLLGSWCKITPENQLYIMQVRIPPYEFGNRYNHDALRTRRLLMHKKEILKLKARVEQKGLSLIPLKIYLNAKGLIKVEVALCQGKDLYDKREAIKSRDADRAAKRAIAAYR